MQGRGFGPSTLSLKLKWWSSGRMASRSRFNSGQGHQEMLG